VLTKSDTLWYTVYNNKGDEKMAISKDSNRIAATVSKEVYDIVTKLAKEQNRSISAMAAILIEKGLKFYRK